MADHLSAIRSCRYRHHSDWKGFLLSHGGTFQNEQLSIARLICNFGNRSITILQCSIG